jgi:hypothetical protein
VSCGVICFPGLPPSPRDQQVNYRHATRTSNYVVMERNADQSSYSGLSEGIERNNDRLLVFDGAAAVAAASSSANDAAGRGSLLTTSTAPGTSMYTPESRKRRLQEYVRSHDFVELVVCMLWYLSSFVVPSLLVVSTIRPIPYQYLDGSNEYVRNLVNDEELQGSTVSVGMLILLGVILPLGAQLAVSVFWGRTGDVQATLCAHLVAQGTTQCATESVKRYVGFLRPIFYAACAPSDDYQACTSSDDNSSIDVRKSSRPVTAPRRSAAWPFSLSTCTTAWEWVASGMCVRTRSSQED